MNNLIVKKGRVCKLAPLLPEMRPYASTLKILIQENNAMAPITIEIAQDMVRINTNVEGVEAESKFTVGSGVPVFSHKNEGKRTEKNLQDCEDTPMISTCQSRLINKQYASAATKGRENQCGFCKHVLSPNGVCLECGEDTSC